MHTRSDRRAAASSRDLTDGPIRRSSHQHITVTCATDGNHGRSVAWGARTFGCRCVIYVHATVSQGRCRAIAAYGAEVRRVPGTYDDAVRRADADAAAERLARGLRHLVRRLYRDPTRCDAGLQPDGPKRRLSKRPSFPTHVFVQGGVGGLAAGVCSYCGSDAASRPRYVVVEPDKADCLYRSAVAGKPTPAEGELDTIMAGLACGEVSILAWRILDVGADAFITVDDEAAADCMRLLADGRYGDRAGGGRRVGGRRAGGLVARGRRHGCALRLELRPRQQSFGVRHAKAQLIPRSTGALSVALRRTSPA